MAECFIWVGDDATGSHLQACSVFIVQIKYGCQGLGFLLPVFSVSSQRGQRRIIGGRKRPPKISVTCYSSSIKGIHNLLLKQV